MSVYDIDGNLLTTEETNLPWLSSSKLPRLHETSDFDASSFSLIHEFTAFSQDYSTATATPRVLNITQEQFYQTFYDPYLGDNGDMIVTKKNLGKDESGLYDVWCYDFLAYNAKKKVLLTSAMHTYELPASFGLARWVKELMESSEPVFAFLRQNVSFSIIPIVNPWGFNQNPKTYGNINGVNPARNFNDWDGAWELFPVYTPSQNEWNVKGDAPFSEAETRILASFMKNNTDADFYIDCHTGLGVTRASSGDVWCIYLTANPLANKIVAAANALGTRIAQKYSVTTKMHVVTDTTDIINQKYSLNVVGVPYMTIEQAQGNDTVYTTVPNNSAVAITEYATQIHAFLISQLQN